MDISCLFTICLAVNFTGQSAKRENGMRLVSLGRACEVGFQIRLHTSQVGSDYFDWLITPFEGLMMALNQNFEGLMDGQDLYRQEDKNFVNNRRTGIQYGHVFRRNERHEIPHNFLDDLDCVKEKFNHFKNRFNSYQHSSEKICFIRRDINGGEAISLCEKLQSIYPSLNFSLACVNEHDLGSAVSGDSRIIDLRVPNSGHDGLGHADHWAEILMAAHLTDRPFQKKKSDIVIPFQ